MLPEVKWLSYLTGIESWLYQIYASLENCRGLLEINKRMNNIHVVMVAENKIACRSPDNAYQGKTISL